jgi:hypothetical protein
LDARTVAICENPLTRRRVPYPAVIATLLLGIVFRTGDQMAFWRIGVRALFASVIGIVVLLPVVVARLAAHSATEGGTLLQAVEPRVCGFLAIRDFTNWERPGSAAGESILISPELALPLPAGEVVVSWNADTPAGSGLEVDARAVYSDRNTKWYSLGRWSLDAGRFPRESVNGQKDTDGDVQTDTLSLSQPVAKLQVRVTLRSAANGRLPELKFIGICAADTRARARTLEPNRIAWGREVAVPARTQIGWPGGHGWCSPTSTDMALAFWSKKLSRPELDLPVPEVAHSIYDKVFDGTGNWPFNTAFAGSFPGIRAYVTRFGDIRELEDWVEAGIPSIVSVSYDLLKGREKDNDPGHLMVCDGFTPTGDIVLNDPAYHPDKGERCRRVFPRANFLKAWARSRNTVYLIYPDGAKIPANRYGDWE